MSLLVFRFLDFARNDNYKMTIYVRDARSEPGMTVVENRTIAEEGREDQTPNFFL